MSAWPMYAFTSESGNDLHGERAESVAQVVEAQVLDPGRLQRAVEAAAQRRVLEELARRAREHEIVLADEVPRGG